MSFNKKDNKLDFRNVKVTQFDHGQTNRMAFSELQSAYRQFNTNTILKDAYTHFIQQTDVEGRPTSVTYYQATDPAQDRINTRADSGGDLAGTYFTLQEFISQKTHVFWFNVSGSGTAPGIGDVEHQINIATNDPASVVAYAVRTAIDALDEFIVLDSNLLSSYVDIEYLQFGETQAVNVGTSGFIASRIKEGDSFEVGFVELSYDSEGSPIYNGNTLKGLLYNPYTASFDVERDEITVTTQADTPSIFNVSNTLIPTAGVETAIVIPDGTKKFKIQAKEANTRLEIAHTSGGPTFTIGYGTTYEENDIKTSGVTIYITTSRDNRTIELLTWA
jgi:hypothetical protein